MRSSGLVPASVRRSSPPFFSYVVDCGNSTGRPPSACMKLEATRESVACSKLGLHLSLMLRPCCAVRIATTILRIPPSNSKPNHECRSGVAAGHSSGQEPASNYSAATTMSVRCQALPTDLERTGTSRYHNRLLLLILIALTRLARSRTAADAFESFSATNLNSFVDEPSPIRTRNLQRSLARVFTAIARAPILVRVYRRMTAFQTLTVLVERLCSLQYCLKPYSADSDTTAKVVHRDSRRGRVCVHRAHAEGYDSRAAFGTSDSGPASTSGERVVVQ